MPQDKPLISQQRRNATSMSTVGAKDVNRCLKRSAVLSAETRPFGVRRGHELNLLPCRTMLLNGREKRPPSLSSACQRSNSCSAAPVANCSLILPTRNDRSFLPSRSDGTRSSGSSRLQSLSVVVRAEDYRGQFTATSPLNKSISSSSPISVTSQAWPS